MDYQYIVKLLILTCAQVSGVSETDFSSERTATVI